MEDEDIKDLKKLLPKERIKKLKKLEERRRKEIAKIEDLIKDSEKELKVDSLAEEVVPQHTEIDITMLFEGELTELEATAANAPQEEAEAPGYVSFKQAYGDYTALKDMAYASMMGPLKTPQMNEIDRIGERLDNSKYQSASDQVANILVASRATLYKIRKYAGLERPGDQLR